MRGKIFVLSGPSGSGKTTLVEELFKDRVLKRKVAKSVSLTTRPKRTGEKQGKHYCFIPCADFKERLKAKKILEWTKYLGYYYATPRDFIEEQVRKNKNTVFCLDLKGAAKVKRLYPDNTVSIFILPPSIDALEKRIRKRCARTREAEICKRLRLARNELAVAGAFDYRVINKNLSQALSELKNIVLREIGTSKIR